MTGLAIIGGTGLTSLEGLEIARREVVHTPFGQPSGPITHGMLGGKEVVFLPRHGYRHTIPPHKVNYRANLWALEHIGIRRALAVASVGGIDQQARPGRLLLPEQIIDYTWSRRHTFYEEDLAQVTHIDFTHPYCEELRQQVAQAARDAGVDLWEGGTYGATQGPRLETAAEINRMERDGCHMVGMTGMPETALARELDLCYATCAVVANWAAGRGGGEIQLRDIERNLIGGMEQVRKLLYALVKIL